MKSCPANFNFEFNPLEFLSLIFNKSSTNPNTPRLKEIKITIKTYIFFKSAHKKVPKNIPSIIIKPPIVGVPDFLII